MPLFNDYILCNFTLYILIVSFAFILTIMTLHVSILICVGTNKDWAYIFPGINLYIIV